MCELTRNEPLTPVLPYTLTISTALLTKGTARPKKWADESPNDAGFPLRRGISGRDKQVVARAFIARAAPVMWA